MAQRLIPAVSKFYRAWINPARLPVGGGLYAWTGCCLWWEKIAAKIWPYGLAVFLFLIAAWFDVFVYMPGWLHAILLVGLGWYGLFGLRSVWLHGRWPEATAIYHRLELDSALRDRPLTGLQDCLPKGASLLQQEWWQWHTQQLRQRLGPLRWGWPRFGFAPNDPYALRSLVLLVFAIGIISAGRDWPARLDRALQPNVPPASALVQNWHGFAEPPAYTGLPRVDLRPLAGQAVSIPVGSEIFMQVHGAQSRVAIRVDGASQPLENLSGGSFTSRFTVSGEQDLSLRLGWQELAHWSLAVIPDRAPQIAWQGEVYATPRAALRLGYDAEDDYGLHDVTVEITKADSDAVITLPLPRFPTLKGQVQNSSYHDLAWHEWVDQEVRMQLIATDALGQRAESAVITTVLPRRVFKHPVAIAVDRLRTQFQRGEIDRGALAAALQPILATPEAFQFDTTFTLGTRVAKVRASLVPDARDDQSLLALLWDLALRLDDQGVSLAERDLRSIEQAIQDAIARGASAAEMEALLDQYTAAMNEYLQSMLQQMDAENAADLPGLDPSAASLEINDLDRMLAQIRQLLQSGQTAEAQQLLSKLQEMMANLRQNQGQPTAAQKAMQRLIATAQGLIRRQQLLLDHTTAQTDGLAKTAPLESQSAIRRDTEEFLSELRAYLKPPQPFDTALAAMRRTEPKNAPAAIRGEEILSAQTVAVSGLREGLRELLQNMQNSGGGGGMVRAGSGAYDPFGRARAGQGPLDDQSVKVPGLPELQRSQEILRELQDRSGDFNRPEIERDYIKRLLRRF